MKYLKLVSLLFATVLIFAGCDKNKNELPVEFKFVLLDTLGNEKTVFNQGETIIFSFQVINNSSEDLMLENFLRVYQPNTNEGDLDCGKPYTGFTLRAGYSVYTNDTLHIKYLWNNINSDNHDDFIIFGDNKRPDLPKGIFYTEFTQSFKIGEFQTEEKYFKISFTVK